MSGIRAIGPQGSRADQARLKLSAGIVSGDNIFLTGMTGSLPDGSMPTDPAEQFRNAFGKIASVLESDGLDLSYLVEITTYHIDLEKHFEAFDEVRLSLLTEPYPAWTAVEVAGLRRAGALVEIRAIASTAKD